MKNCSAFAFRNFDTKRILSRPFFRKWREGCHVEDGLSDEEILTKFSATDEDSLENTQKKFNDLIFLRNWIGFYINHINRHGARLDCFARALVRKFIMSESDELFNFRVRNKRVPEIAEIYYRGEAKMAIENLCFEDIPRHMSKLDEKLKTFYRGRFATRLKRARKENHLTQKKLAEKLNMSQNTYSQYETAKIEPSLATLIKISQALHRPTDWLLGLTI